MNHCHHLYLLHFIVNSTVSIEVMDQIQHEGDTASFTCQATGGTVPTISWYFNGTLLADGATYTISETSVNTTTINSILTIMSVRSSDVGTYTCNATNVVSSDTSSGVLTVNGESIIKREVYACTIKVQEIMQFAWKRNNCKIYVSTS